MRTLLQAGYFILLARELGSAQYGAFIGVTALVAMIAPFASLGAGDLLIKNVARDRRLFPEYWGNALLKCVASGAFLLALMVVIAPWAMPKRIGAELLVLVSVSDLLLLRIAEIAAQGFQALEQLRQTAILNTLPHLFRLVCAMFVFVTVGKTTAQNWGKFYLGSTVASAAFAIFSVSHRLGRPKTAVRRIPRELLDGLYFATSLSSQTIYNDVDKTMLARLSTFHATGIYAAAYRLIEVSFTPVRSVLNAAYPQFFRHGENGPRATYLLAKRLILRTSAYSLLASLSLFVAAPIAPLILGPDYAPMAEALRWLSLLPLLKTAHYFLADSLTGSGHQKVRATIQLVVAGTNVVLNFWLIPAYAWRGAAWASLASDGLLVLALYFAVSMILRRHVLGGKVLSQMPRSIAASPTSMVTELHLFPKHE